MITTLVVNGLELTVDYDLEINPVYFGDLESSYINIDINKVIWMGNDVLPLIRALEDEESLKFIIQSKFEETA